MFAAMRNVRSEDGYGRWLGPGGMLLAASLAAFVVSGCATTATGDKTAGAAQTPDAAARQTLSPTTSATPSPAKGHTSSHHATAGAIANAVGAILPNPARTPGAINPAVTQANIGKTICVSGWTATVRPSSSVTTSLKIAQLNSGYAYKGDHSTSDYEEDHLISLELGGAPSAPANLWPEPYASAEGARVKDTVENRLHTLVCNHSISLATAQHAIASNCWTAYKKYVGTSQGGTGYVPTSPTHAAPSATTSNGATAKCNDGTYSYAAHHQGACSSHGGVAVFYK